jgi:predicted esterase
MFESAYRRGSLRFVLLACLVCCMPALALAQEPAVPPAAPQAAPPAAPQAAPLAPEIAAIDPLAPGALEGLEFDAAALEKQATLLYQGGSYMDAARAYLALLKRDPGNAAALYNLACCYGLLGKDERAGACLKLAAQAGWSDIDWAKNDPDFALVRGMPAFDQALSGLSASRAEKQAGLGELLHFTATSYLPCRVLLPQDYDPARTYSLIVGLHGYGDNHEHFTALRKKLGDIPVIFAVPEAPYPFPQGNETGYSWMEGGKDGSDEPWKEVVRLTEKYVLDVVAGLKQRYNIGEIYLLGFSQGCGLAYMVGLDNPDVFAGLICFGGWLDTDWLSDEQLARAKALRVFIGHGTEDRMVEFKAGEAARDKLQALGYDVTFFQFAGGHRVPEEATQAAAKWLLREP